METHVIESYGETDVLRSEFEEKIASLGLNEQNIRDLERIQFIYIVEENKFLRLDEVLARILKFYQRYVPYK